MIWCFPTKPWLPPTLGSSLFLRVSAVVMEVGGCLLHGAIVAREYAIPAVVNIPGLLDAVEEGQPLLVDGDAGRVVRKAGGSLEG